MAPQIGQVAELTGLGMRTIRHYEEVGLAPPTARSAGGFRLYTDTDVARLRVIMRMKPLEFTLEEMRDLLEVLHRLDDPGTGPAERERLPCQVAAYRDRVDQRCAKLPARLAGAEDFSTELGDRLEAGRPAPRP
ncbi:MerR family transcriptional regulator [Spirillospora sp. NBC_01491]|nr:MerR family transcriptional regulator [Actinomadura xylanilytica]MDL4776810.1 MerR family transcriptional regulator [Actinomadura xylanilytica]